MSAGVFYHSLFIETGGFTEPGPHTLARLAGHQALRTLLSLPHIFRVTVTFFHTGVFHVDSGAFEQRSFYLQTLSLPQPWSLFIISA